MVSLFEESGQVFIVIFGLGKSFCFGVEGGGYDGF